MSTDQDQARLIAERVARRVAGTPSAESALDFTAPTKNGAPVREELSAIREGLHDLEHKLDRIESKITQPDEPTRARLIDFVSSGPPLAASPTISQGSSVSQKTQSSPELLQAPSKFVPPTQSPWLRDFNSPFEHPSQERFGVEEATVAELVEFFESEKKCSVEPGGKPCDHCSMCSSRGF